MAVLGVQLYSLREFTQTIEDFATTIEKVAKIGYKAVQISGTGPLDAAQVGQICRDNGVAAVGSHVGWDRFVNDIDGVIADHQAWECKHAAIGGLFGDEWAGLEGIKQFVDQLGPIAEKLAAAGMDFSYHNHSHEFVKYDGKLWLEALYDMAPASMLKAELDTYWVQAGGGNPAAWIRKYPNRQPLLHLKDMKLTLDRQQQFAPIGEGNLDWDDILAAAKESNCGWYLIEQDDCYGRDPFECMASSFNFLKSKGLS